MVAATLAAAGDEEAWFSVMLQVAAVKLAEVPYCRRSDGCVRVCVCVCQAAGERTLKYLPSVVKKIEVMFVFGALAMSAELYTL